MDEDKNRINIDDLPQAAEELTEEEAKDVQGGLTKVGAGTLTLNSSTASSPNFLGGVSVASGDVNNTVGGSLTDGTSDPTKS